MAKIKQYSPQERDVSTRNLKHLRAVDRLGCSAVCPHCNRPGTLISTSHGWWKCYCGTRENPKKYFAPIEIINSTRRFRRKKQKKTGA